MKKGMLGCLAVAAMLFLGRAAVRMEWVRPAAGQMAPDGTVQVILDPGHGGMDGGAVSADGLQEKDLNLAIARKTRMLLKLAGVDTAMTRDSDISLGYQEGESVRRNKQNDLKARAQLAEQFPACDFISIHMNQFEQARYRGAQVFYGPNSQSPALAQRMQDAFQKIDPSNNRQIKPAPESIYLMKKVAAPAVIAECGFLSNPQEAALLAQQEYQKKVALAITGAYLQFASQEEEREL